MVFDEELFIGESVEDLSTIVYSIKKGIPVFNIYTICTDPKNISSIEILSTTELLKKRNLQKNYKIIGIAGGKYEAYDLVRYIFQTAADNNSDTKTKGIIFRIVR